MEHPKAQSGHGAAMRMLAKESSIDRLAEDWPFPLPQEYLKRLQGQCTAGLSTATRTSFSALGSSPP